MRDDTEILLTSIGNTIESIDGLLKEQCGDVDGIGYAVKQSWERLNEVKNLGTGIYAAVWLLTTMALVTTIAVVAHVVHHW